MSSMVSRVTLASVVSPLSARAMARWINEWRTKNGRPSCPNRTPASRARSTAVCARPASTTSAAPPGVGDAALRLLGDLQALGRLREVEGQPVQPGDRDHCQLLVVDGGTGQLGQGVVNAQAATLQAGQLYPQ